MLLKMFVRCVRTICPSSVIISLIIPSIPWALCFFILFCVPFHFFFYELGHIFCVWTWFHCTFRRNLHICLEFLLCLMWFLQILSACSLLFVRFCVYWSVLDPFSLLMVIVLISFFSSVLLFCFFFTNLLSSEYSILSFSVLFAFCRKSFLFLCKFIL